MLSFEILCVTMKQKDFSKIEEMNIHSNVVFANQSDVTSYKEFDNNGKYAKMITTNTRGVGKNRNIAFMYSDADICLLADDDMYYYDGLEEKVVGEFESHPDADIIIFNVDTDSKTRKQIHYNKTKKVGRISRMPWGGVRIAFRSNAVKKSNIWFTTLFGGGCLFPSGEDSMWLNDAKRKGFTFYVSDKTIGKINFDESSWFKGYDEKFFCGKGAYYQCVHPKTFWMWAFYFSLRTSNLCDLTFNEKMSYLDKGKQWFTNVK